jgi:hypothetical protein
MIITVSQEPYHHYIGTISDFSVQYYIKESQSSKKLHCLLCKKHCSFYSYGVSGGQPSNSEVVRKWITPRLLQLLTRDYTIPLKNEHDDLLHVEVMPRKTSAPSPSISSPVIHFPIANCKAKKRRERDDTRQSKFAKLIADCILKRWSL